MRLTEPMVKIKYKETSTCLWRINNWYWLTYMYFIILEGESVPTPKFGRPDRWTLKLQCQNAQSYLWKHFHPLNDKIYVRQPISTISTFQTWARVYIFAIFNKKWNNSYLVIRRFCMISHVTGTCHSEEEVNFAILSHFQTVGQLK